MNIKENLKFNKNKPVSFPVRKSSSYDQMAIGLMKGQVLKKHVAPTPTLLTVLEGEIKFSIAGEDLILGQFDTFQIPVDVTHEVTGLEESIFTLTKEKL
jgi:quercetin dioxygenase-like cupin family protein